MTPELLYLAWSAVLLIVHVVIQATVSDLNLGLGYALGSQDEERVPDSVAARRIERSLMNFIETYPAFIALAAVIGIAGASTPTTALGAAVWFWARVAYIPAYASGLPLVRTIVWFASLAGLLIMALPLVF